LKLLLVRLDGIGDALVCTPLVAALRAAGHELGLALSDRNAGVFATRTACAVHVLERIPWPRHGSTPASRAAAEAEIAAQGYDAALIASDDSERVEDSVAAVMPRMHGAFSTVLALEGMAHEAGARVMIVTAQTAGRAAREADAVIELKAQTMASDQNSNASLLPMGSLFEAAELVFFDLISILLRERTGQTPEQMRERHTNLE